MKIKNLRKILIIVFACVFAFAAFNVAKITHGYIKTDNINAELQKQFVKTSGSDITLPSTQMPISVDFDALKEKNKDVVGWLYCPDTPINYPIVQGESNSQYLHADLSKKYSAGGTLFSDYRNNAVASDPNYIVYGHNMKNSSMFGTLDKYKKQTYYDQHPTFYLLTPESNYVIEIFAGAVVKRNSDIYNNSPDTDVISEIIAKSTFTSSVTFKGDENIITLSTCSYEFNNARYVLLGKLIKA